MTTDELTRAAAELGLDAVGATPVGPYTDTERHIRERRARGLFGRMRFTMARPERSCHPETLLPGARTIVAGALCYWSDAAAPPGPGVGVLPRYAWQDHYALLRERLEELGRRVGGEHPVLVGEKDHVGRGAAGRARGGLYGEKTKGVTRDH